MIGGAAGPVELTLGQIKFAQNVLKSLKGRAEARAFLAPVDPVAQMIPAYPTIIKEPMDLGTVDIKLALTAAAAKGGNKPTEKVKLAPSWGLDVTRDVYTTVDQFVREVRLVFANCRTFNGPAHLISQAGDVLESVFDKQMKGLPSKDAPASAAQQPTTPTTPGAPGVNGSAGGAGFGSGDVSMSNGTSTAAAGLIALDRPKREVHPPPLGLHTSDEPQSLSGSGGGLKSSSSSKKKLSSGIAKLSGKSRSAMSAHEAAHWDKQVREELKFCAKVLAELLKPAHQDVAWVFYDLPDRSLDYAPAYYAMIKRPICLNQIDKRVKSRAYADADEFDADVRLLFHNCFTFNPPDSDVGKMGAMLQAVYDARMAKKPRPQPYVAPPGGAGGGGSASSPVYMDEDEYDDEDEEDVVVVSAQNAVEEAMALARALREQSRQLSAQADALVDGSASGKANIGKLVGQARSTLLALGADLPPSSSAAAAASGQKRRKSLTNGGAGGDGGAPSKKKKAKIDGAAGAGAGGGGGSSKKSKKPKRRPSDAGGASAGGSGGAASKSSGSSNAKRASGAGGGSGGGAAGAEGDEEDVRIVTYEQKEELAAKITELPEERLEGALKIIAEDKPHSANDNEEIELDIDDLSPRTLYRLYRYVVRPKNASASKKAGGAAGKAGGKSKAGAGAGGSGAKKNEDDEGERIRKLQAQLDRFDAGAGEHSFPVFLGCLRRLLETEADCSRFTRTFHRHKWRARRGGPRRPRRVRQLGR